VTLAEQIGALTGDLGELHEEHGGSVTDRKRAPVMAAPAFFVSGCPQVVVTPAILTPAPAQCFGAAR
jgi:hypothetical protein